MGLHQESDTECLKFVRSIRLILTDLAEGIDLALKEQKDLDEAVASVVTSKPANGGQVKTGQRMEPETTLFYLFAS
ncbi:MAG: hypothetical protein ACM3TN_18745 [Alphaproteobacteria bacterium]